MHEIGHNLGFLHSSTDDDEYGDPSSVMGNKWLYYPKLIYNYGAEHLESIGAITKVLRGYASTFIQGKLASLHYSPGTLPENVYQAAVYTIGGWKYIFSYNDYEDAPERGKLTIVRYNNNDRLINVAQLFAEEEYFEDNESFGIKVSQPDEFGFRNFLLTPKKKVVNSITNVNIVSAVLDGSPLDFSNITFAYFENGQETNTLHLKRPTVLFIYLLSLFYIYYFIHIYLYESIHNLTSLILEFTRDKTKRIEQ